MLIGVENWARTPPMLFPVDPLPWCVSRSSTTMLRMPASVRWYAMLEPTIPPPMMITSADFKQSSGSANASPMIHDGGLLPDDRSVVRKRISDLFPGRTVAGLFHEPERTQ